MTTVKNLAASVRARLFNVARADKADFNLVLTRYAMERLLYRLSVSAWSEQFLLKGALLFDLWFDHPQRPTRDIDLLGVGPADLDYLTEVFQNICVLPCNDGMAFGPASVRAVGIRANYGGVRITLLGYLDGARCLVQIDVGYGDAITPAADKVVFPTLLEDMPQPVLRAYPVYTVVAEKYHAIVSLGFANSRMKDYFDLWILAQQATIEPQVCSRAVAATFARRGTPVPTVVPLGLSHAFANDLSKQRQWHAFVTKNHLSAPDLAAVLAVLRTFIGI